MSDSAIFSECGQYRYLLTRDLRNVPDDGLSDDLSDDLREQDKIATFIMLNPSTADATRNDPTIRKCIGFARRWQCVRLQVLNLFALRATLPHTMKQSVDPVGPENHQWFAHVLTQGLTQSNLVICAWGVHGAFMGQGRTVSACLNKLGIDAFALGLTRQGQPRHPLYVPYSTELVRY